MKYQLKLLYSQVNAYLANLRPEKCHQKFIIFSQGRTGSTLLYRLLNNQEDITCEGEILNRYKKFLNLKERFPVSYILGRSKLSKKPVYGFKLKIYQIVEHLNLDPFDFLNRLTNEGFKIIYLKRENILEQSISTLIANETGIFHLEKSSDNIIKNISVSKATLEYYMETRYNYLKQEEKVLKSFDYLLLEYSKDLEHPENWENCIKKSLDFLKIPSHIKINTKMSIQKSRQIALPEFIINYLELKEYFSDTKYAKYFP